MSEPFSGSRAWLAQRWTALYMLGFVIFVLLRLIADVPRSYELWRGWIIGAGMRVATALFFFSLALHTWVGVRDVILDYLPSLGWRSALLALLAVSQAAVVAWALVILFPI